MTYSTTDQMEKTFVFMVRGDFARGQRALPVWSTYIGSFATPRWRA